ncbi:hypothetical protein BLNAU_24461 [Blattamonas nauphoetae]|uniref:Uncharacterized protein n=1 Tax=Blattamonas nauphoetae TaxID=2049346 RepID=A0ABQ9WRG0_9EUKA|nr:hypothetical protein BLNAU_24461 [Blattamonas nauphoetae]
MLKQNIPKMGLFVLRFTQLFPYDRAQEFIDPCNLTIKGIKASLKFEVINGLLYTSQTSASVRAQNSQPVVEAKRYITNKTPGHIHFNCQNPSVLWICRKCCT